MYNWIPDEERFYIRKDRFLVCEVVPMVFAVTIGPHGLLRLTHPTLDAVFAIGLVSTAVGRSVAGFDRLSIGD